MSDQYESALNHVNAHSRPSELKITDMRFPDMWAPTDQWNSEYSNDRLFS